MYMCVLSYLKTTFENIWEQAHPELKHQNTKIHRILLRVYKSIILASMNRFLVLSLVTLSVRNKEILFTQIYINIIDCIASVENVLYCIASGQ